MNPVEKMIQAMSDRDPDGWEVKPKDKDYVQFKSDMIKKYGQGGWERYNKVIRKSSNS